jgi:hypothetical protein
MDNLRESNKAFEEKAKTLDFSVSTNILKTSNLNLKSNLKGERSSGFS